MRISDWSSDVCSSDLATAESRHFDEAISRGPIGADHGFACRVGYAGPSQRKDHEMAETIEQLRAINHGFDPDRGNWVHRGPDLSKPTELAPGEAEAFREHYATQRSEWRRVGKEGGSRGKIGGER